MTHFIGVQTDVTREREAHEAVRQSEKRHRTLFETINQGVVYQDEQGAIQSANPAAQRMLGFSLDEMLGRSVADLLQHAIRTDGSDFPASEQPATQALSSGGAVHNVILGVFNPREEQMRWLLVNSIPQFHPDASTPFQVYSTFTDLTERRMLETERERLLAQAEMLLAQAQARADREELINRIGAAIRNSPDPEVIQATAVMTLGQALKANQCYFATFVSASETARTEGHWRHGLSQPGKRVASDWQNVLRALCSEGTVVTVPDVETALLSPQLASVLRRSGLRSLLAVPLLDNGTIVAVLSVATEEPREWTAEEVALVQAVAAQTRAAVESARVSARERNIATQLQEALQPALPGAVPGLALRKYYEAALEEAAVGGDFYDVFPIEKGCTALVVGDLSGKGLAAAAQVAIVRNMLRAMLHLRRGLGEAVTDLNRVLTDHRLLSGFATLFVGIYDSGAGKLAYVNCGQEPGLVRRASTGQVEELPASGPVLGMVEEAVFPEQAILISPGDAVALFTDGLTEVGPTRRELLGVSGIAALLEQPVLQEDAPSPELMAEFLALRLIAGVDAYARDGARDDVCLLISVVAGGL